MEEITPTPPVSEENRASRHTLLWIVSLVAAFVIGLGAGYLVWARPLEARLKTAEEALAVAEASAAEADEKNAAAQQTAAAGQTAAEGQQEVKRYPVPEDDDYVLGSQEAPITIIKFSDYECPFCKRWHLEVFPQIQAKYGDKVRFVYRDFPLYSIHPNAEPAAIAANCAGEQDQYWDFNDRLFNGDSALSQAAYETYAQELGLDLASFKQCLEENRYQQEVQDDFDFASELGVRSTPTFFINGLAVVGAQPFEVFEQIIDMELAGEIP